MDNGIVRLFTLTPAVEAQAISVPLASLGYSVSAAVLDDSIESVAEQKFCPSSATRVLMVDDQIALKHIAQLRLKHGLFHVVMCPQSLLDRFPTVGLLGAEFCVYPCPIAELEFRLKRSRALLDVGEQAHQEQGLHRELITNMLGNAPAFLQVLAKIKRYACVDATVMINGETGTGKELAARAIHYSGISQDGPFQALNCGAIPDHLVENELFGHAKGAYTDAGGAQKGLVELAAGGTLFLDEVDALSTRAQGALLRFLQDGSYRELGSGTEKRVSLRVISATNQDLEKLSEQGLFRHDLYYRLNTLSLIMPSLQDRSEDIPMLATHFVKQCAKRFKLGAKIFHPATLLKMKNYHWPGNIRELESFVQRAYLDCAGTLIIRGPADRHENAPSHKHVEFEPSSLADLSFVEAKRVAIEQFESNYIASLLKETHGNVSEAARLAGKERRCFGKLVKKYHIDRDAYV